MLLNSIVDTPHEQLIKLIGDQMLAHPQIIFYRNLINLLDKRNFVEDLVGMYSYDFQSKFDEEIKNFEPLLTKEVFFNDSTNCFSLKHSQTSRDEILIELLKLNDISKFVRMVEEYSWELTDKVLEEVVENDDWEKIITTLHVENYRVVNKAVGAGNIQILDYYRKEKKYKFNRQLFETAVEKNKIQSLNWLCENTFLSINQTDGERLYGKAAEQGNEEVLRWIQRKSKLIITDSIIYHVGFYGKINLLNWFTENKIPLDRENVCGLYSISRMGILSGQVDFLNKLKELKLLASTVEGSKYPHVNEWYEQNGFKVGKPDSHWFGAVIRDGDLDSLKKLIAKFGMNYDAYEYAAAYDKLEILKWLHLQMDEGNLTKKLFFRASRTQNTEMIRWLTLNKCPMSEKSIERIRKYNEYLATWIVRQKYDEDYTSDCSSEKKEDSD